MPWQKNQNCQRTEEKEVEAIEKDHKGDDSPRGSYITSPDLAPANDNPFLHEDSDRKQIQTPTDNKVDNQSTDIPTPGPTNRVSNCTKYSEEFRIKVVLYAKNHTQRAASKTFGIPRGTVSYWCSLYSRVTNIAMEVLDEIIEAAVESKPYKRSNN